MEVIAHDPPGLQHAPRQGLGVHVPPGAGINPPGHCMPGSTRHDPSSRQHAMPGHGFGTHVAPGM